MISVIDMETQNRRQNRLAEFDYGQEGAYFVTLCAKSRARLFQMELPVGNGLRAVPKNVHAQKGLLQNFHFATVPLLMFYFREIWLKSIR